MNQYRKQEHEQFQLLQHRSQYCGLSVRLSHLCTLPMPLKKMRCHLAGTLGYPEVAVQ